MLPSLPVRVCLLCGASGGSILPFLWLSISSFVSFGIWSQSSFDLCVCVSRQLSLHSSIVSPLLLSLHHSHSSYPCSACLHSDSLSFYVLRTFSDQHSVCVFRHSNRSGHLSCLGFSSLGASEWLGFGDPGTRSNMAAVTSLNIPEQPVLRLFPLDAGGLVHHHLILFHQIEGSRWEVGSPDFEVEEDNLTGVHVVPLRRGEAFPDHAIANTIYSFDPLTPTELSVA